MNIWFFIILIVAFAVVVGPITMLRPSPAQKHKEQLRTHARKRGAHFNVRRLPALKTDMDQPVTMPVYYLPPPATAHDIQEWILMRTSYAHEGNFYQEWDWQSEARPNDAACRLLKSYLPQLPASVPALCRGNQGICVFWSERGGIETLDMLIDMLTELRQADSQL